MRIVSLCPSNTEILYALGLGDQVVAVDEYSDYPPEAQKLPKIGTDLNIKIDKIKELKPDLVVASLSVPGMEKNVQMLREAGLNHIVLAPERFTDFLSDIYEVGVACGIKDRALDLIEEYNRRIQQIVDRATEPPVRPRVYFEWWPKPYYTPGALSWITDMIHLVGGENVFRDFDGASKAVSDEEVIERDPELILLCWVGTATKRLPNAPEEVKKRPGWDKMDAVKNGRIITLSEGLFGRPGPRLIDGLELLLEIMNNMFFADFSHL